MKNKKSNKLNQNRKRFNIFFGIIFMFFFLIIAYAAGYIFLSFCYNFTGNKLFPEIINHILSGILGLILFLSCIRLFSLLIHPVHNRIGKPRTNSYMDSMNEMIQAIEKISNGDFNVFVLTEEHSPLEELAKSVNKMVKELGSMEKLRQNFISDVSHEIQSPLTSISGFAALLRDENISKEDIKHYAKIIETESQRLSKLSDNLLKLSTLEIDGIMFETNPFRLDAQIENILIMLEPQWIKKNINLEILLDKIIFNGNADLLSQVWINLLHNAIKFTPENGEIKVNLYQKNENSIICIIKDNGIGISKENQIHIFERFYKVDKSRDRALGGNGLGLSLVKKIIDLYHGTIAIESEEDSGTTFIISLPVDTIELNTGLHSV